jgi:L-serine dehydratase
VEAIRATGRLMLGAGRKIGFDEDRDLLFRQRERLDFHPNAMIFAAFNADGTEIARRTYYLVGGGAVIDEDQVGRNAQPEGGLDIPHMFHSGEELLARSAATGKTIAALMRENEEANLPGDEVSARLGAIREAMAACIDRGMRSTNLELPGGLRVRRRAPYVHKTLLARQECALADPLTVIDWINMWALAVNEENAAGGRVVTAPTNGAAGIVPAVLRYYERFAPAPTQRGAEDFLLTAAAIGSLFKENASISGAEVGCQGEVGVACSMAAAR